MWKSLGPAPQETMRCVFQGIHFRLAFVLPCRRAQLRHYLEQLKKQVPLSSDSVRNTTLNLLREAQLHIKVHLHVQERRFFSAHAAHSFPVSRSSRLQKLQQQDERAERLKDRLRWEQRELRVRLEQLQRGTERMRNNSHGSTMSSERSDSDRGGWGGVCNTVRWKLKVLD